MPPLTSFNIGLFGHVDSGKTALARALTEIVSTAGLDAHPQSKRRGITIDIGFTFFTLRDEYLVTLVDAPGHADLIQSVTSAARIIDAAIVVVNGVEGPQVQMGEHLVILEGLGIRHVVVALNKIDLFPDESLPARLEQVRGVLADTAFRDAPIVPVSAKTTAGIEALRAEIERVLYAPERDLASGVLVPVDHHFPVKGQGTVVTGTVLSGCLRSGTPATLFPSKQAVRVKSIQVAKQPVEEVCAGHRAGIALSGVAPDKIQRGYFLTTDPGLLAEVQVFHARCHVNAFFTGRLTFGQQVHVTLGMTTVAGLLCPFTRAGDGMAGPPCARDISNKVLVADAPRRLEVAEIDLAREKTFDAICVLQERVYCVPADLVLLARYDLPPTALRIIGPARVETVLPHVPAFYREKVKRGTVKHAEHSQGVVVAGMFESKVGAEKYLGTPTTRPPGRILATFGTKGAVVVQLASPRDTVLRAGDPVEARFLWRFHPKLPPWDVPRTPEGPASGPARH